MKTLFQQDLAHYHTFGIHSKAQSITLIEKEEDLIYAIEKFEEFILLGEGSNTIFCRDIETPILKIDIKGLKVIEEDQDQVLMEIGAGENWDNFVGYCVANQLGGVENLSLIPGSCGAAPVQNIGAYGVELSDVLVGVRGFHLINKSIESMNKDQCALGYRDSIFKRGLKGKFIITRVTLRLTKKNHNFNTSYGALQQQLAELDGPLTLENLRTTVITIRESKLPNPQKIGNSGSFFKNPIIHVSNYHRLKVDFPDIPSYPISSEFIKIPAAWLIDQCGWKGKTFRSVGVYAKQALVLINPGNAKGSDLLALKDQIIKDVLQKFQVKLQPEVNIIV